MLELLVGMGLGVSSSRTHPRSLVLGHSHQFGADRPTPYRLQNVRGGSMLDVDGSKQECGCVY